MKKFLFFTLITVFSASTMFAQKKVLKDAKRALDSNNLEEARTLIKQAINHPETANDPETWKLYGDIGNKAFDNERMNQMLGKPANEKVMYEGLLESYYPYVKADSLGQIPDEKGKVRNKVRKDIASILKANHPYYINAGVYFNDQKDYAKASECFEIYWTIPNLPMFEENKDEFVLDSTYQIIKYYAIITAIQADDHERAIELIQRAVEEQPFIENSAYRESDLYELLASEYLQVGDSTKFMEILYVGAEKFPESKYFIPNLINIFIRQGDHEKAMEYLDKAIANDPANTCELSSVKAALLVEKKDYAAAEAEYNKALEQDPNCERALEGLAVNYIIQAQELKEVTATLTNRQQQIENDQKTLEFYQKSLPLLEKYTELLKARNADESEIKSALLKLRNVYYNLSLLGVDKSKELQEVEAELNINQ